MRRRIILFLPILYALAGTYLWFTYGTKWPGLVLWIVTQVSFVPIYSWLLADKSLGLMFRLHVYSMAMGMFILFYLLFPGRVQSSTGHLVFEVVLMGLGTFCCAVGIFSMLYMLIRKLIADKRIARRRQSDS